MSLLNLNLDLWVPALGWALLHFVWQGVTIGLLAGVVLALLRNARPQWRYAVCTVALLACLGLPLGHLLWMLDRPEVLEPELVDVLPEWMQALATQLPALVAAWSLGVGLMALRLGAAPRYFEAADLPNPPALEPLTRWSRALMQAARTAEHPFNTGLVLEALVAQARNVLHSRP